MSENSNLQEVIGALRAATHRVADMGSKMGSSSASKGSITGMAIDKMRKGIKTIKREPGVRVVSGKLKGLAQKVGRSARRLRRKVQVGAARATIANRQRYG
jgi:hypothetical protein